MRFLKNSPAFLFLFPVFFVFHGFTENFASVPVKDAAILVLIYAASAVVITFICWLFYRDWIKASLLAFLLIAYNFFFGSVQDALRSNFPGSFLSRYSFILPLSLLLFIVVIIILKKRKRPIRQLVLYLNLVLLLLLLIDTGWLATKLIRSNKQAISSNNSGLSLCDTCKKPDIYFIILDEYSGNNALKERFGFDNSGFEAELGNRGFHVIPNSNSNYNYTPFSLASLLNMQYLELNMKTKGAGNINYCYQMIRNSRVLQFLEGNGYKLYNYSIFDFPGQPAVNTASFLPSRTKLITAQTFLARVWKDILFNVATGELSIRSIEKKIVYSGLHNNNNLTRLTIETAGKTTVHPKFVYTHLMMPHYPYYFDSKGNSLPFDSLVEGRQVNRHNYVEYLRYCNNKILQLTDTILKSSSSPPVIVLAGDHGFRYFTEKEDRRFCFMNMTAVYLPSKDYRNFGDSLSSVNLFPVLFNTQFQQHITIQKDSTIYLWE